MGLFSKKKKTKEAEAIPNLPELPKPSEINNLNESEIPDMPPGLPQNIPQSQGPPENFPQGLPGGPELPEINVPGKQATMEEPEVLPYSPEPKQPPAQDIGYPPSNPPESVAPMPKVVRTKEVEDKFKGPRAVEIEDEGIVKEKPDFKKSRKSSEPIFIRLDKFETTIESFEEIRSKIIEIEDLLKKTKEIKTREEDELSSWDREIQTIKSRIDSIDKNIFSKLD